MYTKEQLEKLKPLESVFNGVMKAGYKKGTSRAENELVAKLYNSASGKTVVYNFTCGKCMFDLYKNAGELYFKSLEEVSKPEVVEEEVDSPSFMQKVANFFTGKKEDETPEPEPIIEDEIIEKPKKKKDGRRKIKSKTAESAT